MSKRNSQYRYRDATDVQHATVQVKASEFEVHHEPLPSIRVQTAQNKTTQLTVSYQGDVAVIKPRYWLQNEPCPLCYHGRGGVGRVQRTDGTTQYKQCNQCGHTWKTIIPSQVCRNQEPDPQWTSIAEKVDAIEIAWPSLKPQERDAVTNVLLDALNKVTS